MVCHGGLDHGPRREEAPDHRSGTEDDETPAGRRVLASGQRHSRIGGPWPPSSSHGAAGAGFFGYSLWGPRGPNYFPKFPKSPKTHPNPPNLKFYLKGKETFQVSENCRHSQKFSKILGEYLGGASGAVKSGYQKPDKDRLQELHVEGRTVYRAAHLAR